MWTREQFRVEQVGKPHPGGILGPAGKARDRDLRHRRHRLAHHVQVLGWVALPLLRHQLVIALDQRIFRPVAATGGERSNHRLLNHDGPMRLRFDSRLLLAHVIPAFPSERPSRAWSDSRPDSQQSGAAFRRLVDPIWVPVKAGTTGDIGAPLMSTEAPAGLALKKYPLRGSCPACPWRGGATSRSSPRPDMFSELRRMSYG